MPIYEYECDACQHVFEEHQSFSDDPIEVCPECKIKKVRKIITGPSFIRFAGKGQYKGQYYRTAGESDNYS